MQVKTQFLNKKIHRILSSCQLIFCLPCWNSLAFIVVIIQMGKDGSNMAIPTLPNEIAPRTEHIFKFKSIICITNPQLWEYTDLWSMFSVKCLRPVHRIHQVSKPLVVKLFSKSQNIFAFSSRYSSYIRRKILTRLELRMVMLCQHIRT